MYNQDESWCGLVALSSLATLTAACSFDFWPVSGSIQPLCLLLHNYNIRVHIVPKKHQKRRFWCQNTLTFWGKGKRLRTYPQKGTLPPHTLPRKSFIVSYINQCALMETMHDTSSRVGALVELETDKRRTKYIRMCDILFKDGACCSTIVYWRSNIHLLAAKGSLPLRSSHKLLCRLYSYNTQIGFM